jgi:hypothetical protein
MSHNHHPMPAQLEPWQTEEQCVSRYARPTSVLSPLCLLLAPPFPSSSPLAQPKIRRTRA